jgi:hypothetical protein
MLPREGDHAVQPSQSFEAELPNIASFCELLSVCLSFPFIFHLAGTCFSLPW